MGFLSSLPRVSMCCCCIDLRTGTIILGALQLLGALFNLFVASHVTEDASSLAMMKDFDSIDIENEEQVAKIVQATHFSSHAANLISMIFAILLLVGAVKYNTLFLKIYVIFNLIGSALLAVIVCFGIIFLPPFGIILLVLLFISLYYLFCINSFLQLTLDRKVRAAHVEIDFKPVYPAHQQIIITS